MSKTDRKILIGAILFIVISNLLSPAINLFAEGMFQSYHYQSVNAEFEFVAIPAKGRDTKVMEAQFADFLSYHSTIEDKQLYRTFRKDFWKFWNWYAYLFRNVYQYPYIERTWPLNE